jgi:hypothetical protein
MVVDFLQLVLGSKFRVLDVSEMGDVEENSGKVFVAYFFVCVCEEPGKMSAGTVDGSFKELGLNSVMGNGVTGVIEKNRDSVIFFVCDWSCGRFRGCPTHPLLVSWELTDIPTVVIPGVENLVGRS